MVFMRDQRLLLADKAKHRDRAVAGLHYVWDASEDRKKGDKWIDPDSDAFQLGPLKLKTIYPHIVVATTRDTLGAWLPAEADIGKDYRDFFDEEPPPVRAVIVHTNCQYGPADQVRVAEGGVGGLEFVKKIDGKCPPMKP